MTDDDTTALSGDRLAKVIARAGLCSRRDAEEWIKSGRVSVNGTLIRTPAFNVADKDKIKVDGKPLEARKGTRVWLYHKPEGLVVTEKDPEGRPTVFDKLAAEGLPRVLSIGRLDINTEGLLLLTNDGGLKRVLELPATGWLRRYRVRAFGSISQAQLDVLKDGMEIEGVKYGPIEALLEREQGSNVWLVVSLREGKNREVKNVLGALGLVVNRLIRVSYGPFQLGDLPIGGVEVVKARVLREQLGKKLAEEAGVDFDSELPEPVAITQARRAVDPNQRASAPGADAPVRAPRGRTRQVDAEELVPRRQVREERPVRHRPGRADMGPPPKPPKPEKPAGRPRRILFDDGREETFVPAAAPRKRGDDDKPAGKFGDRPPRREGGSFESRGPRPPRRDDDRPRPPRGDRPERKSFGDRDGAPRAPRAFGDRPARPAGDRPARGPRPEGASRSPRPQGDRPARKSFGDRDGAPRAPRAFGDKPARGPRPEGGGFRGPRPQGDRPSRGPRPDGDRPSRVPRPEGASRGPRPQGDRPSRGPGGPSRGPKPGGASRGPRPGGPGRGPKPGGPRPPRKPRA